MSRRSDPPISADDIPDAIKCCWCGGKIPFSYLNTVDHRSEPTLVIESDSKAPDEVLYFCSSTHKRYYKTETIERGHPPQHFFDD